jgi:hypothetical protein
LLTKLYFYKNENKLMITYETRCKKLLLLLKKLHFIEKNYIFIKMKIN